MADRRQTIAVKLNGRVRVSTDYEQWRNIDDFLDFATFADLFKQKNCEYLLCQDCCEALCKKIRETTNFYRYQYDILWRVRDNPPPDPAAKLKSELDTLLVTKQSLNDAIDNAHNCNTYISQYISTNFTTKTEFRKSTSNLASTFTFDEDLDFQTPICISNEYVIKSFTLNSAFHISTSRFYGTINNCRIGTKTPNEVDDNEFTTGLFFLVHFIVSLGKITQTPIENHFKVTNPAQFYDEQKKMFLPLTAADTHGKSYNKRVQIFRKGIKAIFVASQMIFKKLAHTNDNFMPPHKIYLKTNRICTFSYLYTKDNPQIFTEAMKLLLTDMKCLQRLALEFAIESIE